MRYLLIIILLGSNTLFAQGKPGYPLLDSITDATIRNTGFEGVILVAEAGMPIFVRTNGFQDTPMQKPIQADTRFAIASITKMITSLLILQLEEEGKLRITDRVHRWLPELALPDTTITLHHLLLHISGLPSEDDTIYLSKTSPEQFIKETLAQKDEFNTPGSFKYNNTDYMILGKVIEKASGKSWEENVRTRIIDRLQLANTGIIDHTTLLPDFALSFTKDTTGTRMPDSNWFIANYQAAGGMYSNVYDLLKLEQAMYDEDFLSSASRTKMFTSYPEYNYSGYGVWTYQYPFLSNLPQIMERRGGIHGYTSVLVRFLDTQETLIILSNNNGFNPDTFGQLNGLKEALMMVIGKTEN